MRLRNTEHLELSTKMENAHTRKIAYTFLDAKSDLQKNRTEPAVFFQNRTETETEPNPRFLSKPNRNRTELEKSITHIPKFQLSSSSSCQDIRGSQIYTRGPTHP